MSLTDLRKDKTPTMAYNKRFKEVIENKYKGGKHIYTDGSKSELGVGVAATTGNRTESASLPKFSCLFTAETHAIPLVKYNIYIGSIKLFYIHRPEKLPTSVSKQFPTNPKVRKLTHTMENLQK